MLFEMCFRAGFQNQVERINLIRLFNPIIPSILTEGKAYFHRRHHVSILIALRRCLGHVPPLILYFHHPCHVSVLSVPRRCHVLPPYFPRPCHVFIVSAPRRWKFFPHHLISVRRFYNYVCSGKGLADKVKGFFNIQEKVAYFSQWTMKIPNLGYKKNLFGNPLQLKFSLFIARKKSDLCTFEVIRFISVLKITRFL